MLSESNQIVKVVKNALPAVVSITMRKNLTSPSIIASLPFPENNPANQNKKKIKLTGGTGFIIDKDGTILTNRHVVEDPKADYIVVLRNGAKTKPKIIARDPFCDIAVLKIEPLAIQKQEALPILQLGDSAGLELGQTVIAIGNALGMFQNTVSTGVVSGLSREIKAQNEMGQGETSLRGLIQTDAAINPGNSGGPLLDLNGRVVGINAAMVFGAENIGFALPVNNAKRDLDDLKKYGRIRQPFLGVRYLNITDEIKNEMDLPVNCGALIIAEPDITKRNVRQAVIPDSPAHKAGVQETDIIVEVASQKITQEKTLNDILQETKIGSRINLKVLRGGKERKLKLTLEER